MKLILPPSNYKISDQYSWSISFNASIIIYYMSTNMLNDIFSSISSSGPFVFTIGTSSGETCNPSIIHIGINLPTKIHYFHIMYNDKKIYILYSYTQYGLYSFSYITRYYQSFDIDVNSVMIYSLNDNDINLACQAINYIDNDAYVLLTLGDEYNEKFMKKYILNKNPNVKLINLDGIDELSNEVYLFYLVYFY